MGTPSPVISWAWPEVVGTWIWAYAQIGWYCQLLISYPFLSSFPILFWARLPSNTFPFFLEDSGSHVKAFLPMRCKQSFVGGVWDSLYLCIKKAHPGSSRCGSVVMNPAISMRMRVWSLASLSGLRIRCCHELWGKSRMWLRSGIAVAVTWAGSYSSSSTPNLGTSICRGYGPKKIKQKFIFFKCIV